VDKIEILIIGAGVVGLAIAERLSANHEVIVVEQEESFGRHTSSRNSEVIHSGIYYEPGSLKAKLCVLGNSMLYEFLKKEELPYWNCGKYVIATCAEEVPIIENIMANGMRNGVEGMKFVEGEEVRANSPQIKAIAGLWVPSTGILDVHLLMKRLVFRTEENGGMAAFSTKVCGINRVENGYVVTFEDGYQMEAEMVINAAGLFSDRVAAMVGIDIDEADYRLHYCKGEYYKTSKIKNLPHLIYPVPHPDGRSLGIHTRLHLDGTVGFGPNAYYVNDLDYQVDETHKNDFYASVSNFINIDFENLSPDDAGIRPKLQVEGGAVRDFIICEEKERNLPGFINLIGIESPGLTCCLAIAKKVENIIQS